MPNPPAIELTGLTKRFKSLTAVAGVSLTVQLGEVVGLLGPNGAGKTTTLRMLAGLIKPTQGTARVAGIDVQVQAQAARRKLGFFTATTRLYERLTPREIISTFGSLHGLDAGALEARVQELSQELELGGFIDQRCGTLSSGQLQRVSIARATVHDPDVYVMDEPTAALDPVAAQHILTLVQRASARGRAVLFSTHRMDEAEYICQRLIFLREGRVVAEGTAADLRARSGKDSLTAAFLHFALGTPSGSANAGPEAVA